MSTDEMYMRRCIQLARNGKLGAPPNPMVGAVVVHDGIIIGEGYHRRCGGPHAEVNAIRSVKHPELLPESTIYVSLEPCAHHGKTPPCADLIIEKGIPRVVIGCRDPFAKVDGLGIKKLQDAGCQVTVGVLEQECLALNAHFITFHTQKRPFITLKWAQSTDGFIDYCRTEDQPAAQFSTPVTQTLVHQLRAESQAIMVGTETAIKDNPTLSNRLWAGASPLRVTIDRKGRIPTTHHLKDGSVPTCIYTHGETLEEILHDLHSQGIQHLLVEGGCALHTSFIQQGLWDEIRTETAPAILGGGIPAPVLPDATLVEEVAYGANTIRLYVPKAAK